MSSHHRVRLPLQSRWLLCSLPLIYALTPLAFAGNDGELGGPASPLEIAEWIKGGPVQLAEGKGKKIYVVEFWATCCPPCRASIPHLTALQKKFKDKNVTVIGISDEEPGVVRKFVERMSDKMDYTVAVDDEKSTAEAYMEAFGINGIPHAFVINTSGQIVWEGHPMHGLDEAVEQVVAGKYDISKSKKRALAREKLQEFYDAASEGVDEEEIVRLGTEVEAMDAEVGGIDPGKKFNALEARKAIKFQELLRKYSSALSRAKEEEALQRLEAQLLAVAPKEFDLPRLKEQMAASRVFSDYYRAATSRAGKEKLAELGKNLSAAKVTEPQILNQWAWTLLTDERIKSRDIELATILAKRAVDNSEAKNGAILDTYARALFEAGKVSEAITWQKRAVAINDDEHLQKDLEDALKEYQAKVLAK